MPCIISLTTVSPLPYILVVLLNSKVRQHLTAADLGYSHLSLASSLFNDRVGSFLYLLEGI